MAIYYVSTTGNDSNSGVIGSPFLTIAHAVSILSAGDTLYIRGATWTGSAYENTINSQHNTVNTGTSWVSPITISGYPGETVIIQPPYSVNGIALYNTATAYVIFQDLIIDMINTTAGADADGVIFAGDPGTVPHHIRIQRCEVKNGTSAFFGIHTTSGVNNIEILYCTVHDFGTSSSANTEAHGVYVSGNDCLYLNNHIYNNAGFGLHVYNNASFSPSHTDPNRNIIANNRVHDCGFGLGGSAAAGIVISWGDSNKCYNNLLYNNSSGAKIYTSATNTLFANNTIYGNTGLALWLQYYGTGNIIRNNIIYGNGQDGYIDYDVDSTLLTSTHTGTFTADHNLIGINPSFTSAGTADFTLQSGSAAIDIGITIAAFSTDILGASRPQGVAWDIGAYEFGGSPPPPGGIAFVNRSAPNGATASSASTLTTVATSHTTGNLVACIIRRQNTSAVSTVTDTASNTYIKIVDTFSSGDGVWTDIWYAYDITGNASNVITVVLGSASTYSSVVCYQFSGVGAAASFGTSAGATGTGTVASTGTVTTTGSDSVIIGAFFALNASWTAGSGYTLTAFAVTGDVNTYFADEYHLVSASEAATAMLGSGGWGAVAVSFNATTSSSSTIALTGDQLAAARGIVRSATFITL